MNTTTHNTKRCMNFHSLSPIICRSPIKNNSSSSIKSRYFQYLLDLLRTRLRIWETLWGEKLMIRKGRSEDRLIKSIKNLPVRRKIAKNSTPPSLLSKSIKNWSIHRWTSAKNEKNLKNKAVMIEQCTSFISLPFQKDGKSKHKAMLKLFWVFYGMQFSII